MLIIGKSGAGKSALALELMALGAVLVADDRTILKYTDHGITASCPAEISGKIEARGFGILRAETQSTTIVRLVVDLDQVELTRLPPHQEISLLGINIPLLHAKDAPHLPAAVIQLLKGGRVA